MGGNHLFFHQTLELDYSLNHDQKNEDSVHRLVGEQSSEAVKASATEFILEGLHLNKRLNKETLSSLGDSIYKA